jgi:RNA polymerase sigma factor (TIGR02999 family)
MNDVTRILTAAVQGDPHAAHQLLPLVYDELRKLAAQRLAGERPGQTLDATALVHEAYLRLVPNEERAAQEPHWSGRGHFFGAAAEAMRRILIERAREKATHKRGGDQHRIPLDVALPVADEQADELLALDEALTELERHDEPAARLVKLRYFAGLTHQEAADALGVSRRVADRLWTLARAWLYQQLRPEA